MDRLFSRSYSNRIRSTNWACALCEGPSVHLILDFSSPKSVWRRRRGRKLKSLPQKTAYSCIFEPENVNCFKESSFQISPWNPHFTSLGEIQILKHTNLQLVTDYPSSETTDGSKTDDGVAAATVFTKHLRKPYTCRFPDDSFNWRTGALQTNPLSSQACLPFSGKVFPDPFISPHFVQREILPPYFATILELPLELTRRLFLSGFLVMWDYRKFGCC